MSHFLVTGGYGFIGSHFANFLSKEHSVVNVDKNGYASNPKLIDPAVINYEFDLAKPIKQFKVQSRPFDCIFHFAAESHVDNSIKNATEFIKSNVLGTQNILELVRSGKAKRLIHISTDEVYGHLIGNWGSFQETDSLMPRSPYAASKAASDLLVLAHATTYSIPVNVTRCCNNYGPHQHIEKFIPKAITNILAGKKIPVYGDGLNVREWIYVQDHVDAIWSVYERGRIGEIYNIGSGVEMTNLNVIAAICTEMGVDSKDFIEFVPDRLGHDWRYSVNTSKIKKELSWKPKYEDFTANLKETIKWYKSS